MTTPDLTSDADTTPGGDTLPPRTGFTPTAHAVATAVIQSNGGMWRLIAFGIGSSLLLAVIYLFMGQRSTMRDYAGAGMFILILAMASGVLGIAQQVGKDTGNGIFAILTRTPSSRLGLAAGYIAGALSTGVAMAAPPLIFVVIARSLSGRAAPLAIAEVFPYAMATLLSAAGIAWAAACGRAWVILYSIFIVGLNTAGIALSMTNAGWNIFNPLAAIFTRGFFDDGTVSTAACVATIGAIPPLWWFVRAFADRINRPDLPGVGIRHGLILPAMLVAAWAIGAAFTFDERSAFFSSRSESVAIISLQVAVIMSVSALLVPRMAFLLTSPRASGASAGTPGVRSRGKLVGGVTLAVFALALAGGLTAVLTISIVGSKGMAPARYLLVVGLSALIATSVFTISVALAAALRRMNWLAGLWLAAIFLWSVVPPILAGITSSFDDDFAYVLSAVSPYGLIIEISQALLQPGSRHAPITILYALTFLVTLAGLTSALWSGLFMRPTAVPAPPETEPTAPPLRAPPALPTEAAR